MNENVSQSNRSTPTGAIVSVSPAACVPMGVGREPFPSACSSGTKIRRRETSSVVKRVVVDFQGDSNILLDTKK